MNLPRIINHKNLELILDLISKESYFKIGNNAQFNQDDWFWKPCVLEVPTGEVCEDGLKHIALIGKNNYEFVEITGKEGFTCQGLEGKVCIRKPLFNALMNIRDLIPIYRGRIITRIEKKGEVMSNVRREKEKRRIQYVKAKEAAEKDLSGFDVTTIDLPKGMSLFSFKKEDHYRIDVLPYVVGKKNPRADEGMIYYERRYYVHKNIGPENKWYTCPAKTFGHPCPVCEHVHELEQGGRDKKTIDALRAKMRQLWAIVDLDDDEKKIQIHEGPYYNGLGELLSTKIAALENDDPRNDFFHLDGGMTLKVYAKSESGGTGKFIKPVDIDMVPRRKGYDESVLDDVPCLDKLPRELSYDELHEIYYQTGGKKSDSNGSEEFSDNNDQDKFDLKEKDEVVYKNKECEIVSVGRDGLLTLESSDGKVYKKVDPKEVEKLSSQVGAEDKDGEIVEEENIKLDKNVVGGRTEPDEDEDEEEEGDEWDENEDEWEEEKIG